MERHIWGVELKLAHIRQGLNQYELAQRVGIAPNRLSEIEAGRRTVSTELIRRITEVLDLELAEGKQL